MTGPGQARWWIGVWSMLMLCSCIGGRPTAVPSAAVVNFQTTRYTLPGGLRVVAEQTLDSDVSGVVLLVRAGSAAEPQGLAGIAHLTEHLVFQSRQDGKPSFWQSLGALGGGTFNGMTAWDYTAYFAFVPTANHAALIDLMTGALSAPLSEVTEQAFAHELAIVDNERRLRTENGTPGEAVGHLAAATFAGSHAYSRPVVGTPQSLGRLTLEHARAFAETHYRADNAILVSAGPLPVAEQTRLVSESLSRHAGAGTKAAPRSVRANSVQPNPKRELVRRHGLVAAPTLWVGWSVPAAIGARGDVPALLQSMLEGAFWENVRERDRDISRVETGFIPGADASLFFLEVTLVKGDDPEAALESLLARMGPGLVQRIHTRTIIEAYKRHVATRATYGNESIVERALGFALSEHFAGESTYLQKRGERLVGLDADTVRGYFDAYLSPAGARAVLIEPASAAQLPPPLGELDASLERGLSAYDSDGQLLKARRDWMQSIGVARARERTLANGLRVVVLTDKAAPFHTALLGFHGGVSEARLRDAAAAASWARSYRSYSPSVAGRLSESSMEPDSLWRSVRSTGSNIQGTLRALREEVSGFSIDWPPPQFHVQAKGIELLERAPEQVWLRERHQRLYGSHPYGSWSTIASMRKVTATHIHELLAELRQPKNGMLVIVGDIDEDQALAAAEAEFSRWHAGGNNNRALPALPPLNKLPAVTDRVLRVPWPGASLARVGLDCVLTPARNSQDDAALDVFEIVMDRVLLSELRGGAARAYSVDVQLQRLRGGTRVFSFTTAVTPDRVEPVLVVLDRFLQQPGEGEPFITPERVEAARSQLSREYNVAHATSASIARIIFSQKNRGFTLASVDEYPNHLMAVRPEAVARLAAACREQAFVSVLSDPSRFAERGSRR